MHLAGLGLYVFRIQPESLLEGSRDFPMTPYKGVIAPLEGSHNGSHDPLIQASDPVSFAFHEKHEAVHIFRFIPRETLM